MLSHSNTIASGGSAAEPLLLRAPTLSKVLGRTELPLTSLVSTDSYVQLRRNPPPVLMANHRKTMTPMLALNF